MTPYIDNANLTSFPILKKGQQNCAQRKTVRFVKLSHRPILYHWGKGGVGAPNVPKMLALPPKKRGGGGLCPLTVFFLRICTQCPEVPPKWSFISYHPKVIISSQKCAIIPQNRSFNPILAFHSQKWFTHNCRKMSRIHIYALLWAKFARIPGLGGGEQW